MGTKRRVFVAGHKGLVGSALCRTLSGSPEIELITRDRKALDLLDQAAVHQFFKEQKIDQVYLAAAKVGGIYANATFQADFLYENLAIATNMIHAAAISNVEKLLFLGSSCIYPKLASQPIQENSLLTGPLEPTNEGYAIAKIAGLKLCEMYQRQYGRRFISAMPTNLYGPGDNFHPTHSHVIPGMLRRFHEAKHHKQKTVSVWGTGTPKREFLHVDDLASALVLLMEKYEDAKTINVGTGQDCTIRELAETMQEVTGFSGQLQFDTSKPDGTPRKVLNVDRIRSFGWAPRYDLKSGLQHTYKWALNNKAL